MYTLQSSRFSRVSSREYAGDRHTSGARYAAGKDSAEVGYWTAAAARNRGVASQAVEMVTTWAFESFGAAGLRRIQLLHQHDNLASCRVAQKSGYALTGVLPADLPPSPSVGTCIPDTSTPDRPS